MFCQLLALFKQQSRCLTESFLLYQLSCSAAYRELHGEDPLNSDSKRAGLSFLLDDRFLEDRESLEETG